MLSDSPDKTVRASTSSTPANMGARPYLLALGILLAFWGQVVLLGTALGSPEAGRRQVVAGVLLILGAVLFGLATVRLSPTASLLEFGNGSDDQSITPWYHPAAGLVVSLSLALAAIVLFANSGETPLIIATWLAAILILFLAQFWRIKLTWPTGLRQEWPYLIFLVLVMGIALVTRVYHLATLPYNFDGDFASYGLEARALITGAQPHILVFGWGPAPMLGEVPAALTMKVFGDNIVGLNASGVIAGLLSILGVYLLGRDLFQPRLGLIAAALLTLSYAHLAASRQAHFLDPVPILVFSIYFLLIGLREQRGWAIVASGIMTALCLAYFAGRIAIPILGYLFLFLLIFYRIALFRSSGWLLLWLLAILITLGPMLVVFSRDWDALSAHTTGVFILNSRVISHEMSGYGVSSLSAVLWEQARRSILLFHYYPDTGTAFGLKHPLLDPITAPLFTLGLGLAAFQLRRLGPSLMLAWTFLGVLLGSFVEENPPSWSRLMILLPAAALLAALALNALYEFAMQRLDQRPRIVGLVAPVALSLLLAWIGIRNWNTYVEVAGSYASGLTRIARYVADQPPATRAYLVSTSGWTIHTRELEFLIPGRFVADLPPDQVKPGIARVGSPTLFILTSEQTALANELPQLYPGGRLTTEAGNTPGEVAFYAFQLP
jgi:Dolichyl-phosphate-mannose-protein mannosyltransferase